MFLLQKLWIKKHKKLLTFFSLLLILWTLILCYIFYSFYEKQKQTFYSFYEKQTLKWINKYIEAKRRAEVCLPMQPKIITKKI